MIKRVIQILDRILGRTGYYALLASGILILLMSWLSTYGVVRRYFFHNPEPYSYELSTSFLVACVILAIAELQRHGQHLRVDFLASRFSEGVQDTLINIFTPILALSYIVILTWQSWDHAWYSLKIGEISQSSWGEPWWPTKMVVPIGSGLLCLVLIAQLCRSIASTIQRIRIKKTRY